MNMWLEKTKYQKLIAKFAEIVRWVFCGVYREMATIRSILRKTVYD